MRKFLTYLIILIAAAGCGSDNCEDPFYSANHGYDVWSIPLIEPLWLGSTTGVNGNWFINKPYDSEQNFYKNNGVIDVTHVNVIDSLIIAYYYDKYLLVTPEDTIWYLQVPHKKIGFEYRNRNDFVTKTKEFTAKEIKFYATGTVYNEKLEKGFLEWYPKEFKACKLK
jgi:hypothetical protein